MDEIVEDEIMEESLPESDTSIPDTDAEGFPLVDGVQTMEIETNEPVVGDLLETNDLTEKSFLD